MTEPDDKPRSTKQGKLRSPDEIATIIVVARTTSQPRAGKQFSVAARTIGRWEAGIKRGKMPEVASLVREKEANEARKRADLLDAAYDDSLQALRKKLPDATIDQLISATKTLGDLRITRDSLRDDELDRPDRQGAGAEEASGAASRGKTDQGAESGSGHQAGTGFGPGPFH